MKKKIVSIILAWIFVLSCAVPVSASTSYYAPGNTSKSGQYIYYSYNGAGLRMGIRRLDTKTNKTKEIATYLNKTKETHGFSKLTAKGNYIYAVYDLYNGTDMSLPRIWRVSKDGKKRKMLDFGSEYVIIGDWIYYIKQREVLPNGIYVTNMTEMYEELKNIETLGIYKMKLDGTKKTCVYSQGVFTWEDNYRLYNLITDKKNLYFQENEKWNKLSTSGKFTPNVSVKEKDINKNKGNSYSNFEYKRTINGYTYVVKNGKITRKKSGDSKTKTIFSPKISIDGIDIVGDYIFVTGNAMEKNSEWDFEGIRLYLYSVKIDGTKKKLLAKWWAAE